MKHDPAAVAYNGDPSIEDQLREAAERCEAAAAEQMANARRYRAALAALEGKDFAPLPVVVPNIPYPTPAPVWPPQAPYWTWPVWVGDPPWSPGFTITCGGTIPSWLPQGKFS